MPFKTTKQRYYIVREDLAGKDLVNKRVKIETDEVELTQVAALIDTYPEKASIFDKEFAEKVWKLVE